MLITMPLYRKVQANLDKVLLVTRDGLEPPGLDGVKADYQALLPGAKITYQLVDAIPPSPSGKTRYAIRQFPLENTR